LRQYDVRELGEIEQLRVDVEQLAQKRLEAVEVDCGLWVEPLEVDVHHVHVLAIRERGASHRRRGAYLIAAGLVVVGLLALV
jgi:hypothetical protein